MAVEKESKIYNVSLISYAPVSFIKSTLENHLSQIKAFSFCYHDRDIDDNGKPKEPHIHILICSKMPMYLSTYINWFKYINDNGEKENTLGQKLVDIKGSYQYLIHENDPDKFQYEPTERISYNSDFFVFCDPEDKAKLALTDILAGCSLRDCALRYGRDFIYHYGHMRQLIKDIEEQEGISLLNIK